MRDTELKGSPAQGLFGATVGFFFGFAAVALFGPTAARFQEAMGLSPAMVGLLVAMPALSGSLLRIPFSAWVDTTGGRTPFLVLLAISAVGMAGLTLLIGWHHPEAPPASAYPLLLVLGVLSGAGIATFSVGISQISYWYPQDRQGTALGIYAGVGNLGPGLFSFLLPLALASLGLLGSYVAWLLFLLVGVGLYVARGRNAWYFQLRAAGRDEATARREAEAHGQRLFPAGSPLQTLRISAAVWKTWVLVAIYFATFGGFIALTAWFPTYWSRYFELSAVLAGSLTALYSLLTSLIRVGGGFVSDRLGGERTVILSLAVMLAGAAGLTVSADLALSVVSAVVLALGMGVANAAVFKLVPQEVPQAVGGAAGWVGGLGAFGGFAIPPVMGAVAAAGGQAGYARGFVVFVALALVCLGLGWILARSRSGGHAAPGSGAAGEADPAA